MDAEYLHGFYLGDLFIEPLKGRVTGPSGETQLPPTAADVLLCLVASPGELVTREYLIEGVWGEGQGSSDSLSHAVSEIRQALGDHADNPKFIQTLPRRGYRLIVTPTPASRAHEALPPPPVAGPRWWNRLLRHGVIQASVAYLVAGWLLIQVADATFEQLGLPAWSQQFVTFMVIGGLPVLVLLAWSFEFVGGRIEADTGRQSGGIFQGLERNYLAIFIAYGVAALGAGVYQTTVGFEGVSPPPVAASSEPELRPVAGNSIAVLPFLNNDGGEETQVFANGLVDDVITRLSRVPGLLVSSRGDSATLAPNSASAHVRQRLRVAMYLEGSVEMRGDEIRVIVQLIDSETGFHKLSRTFDRPRTDFFDIRDEITELTVSSLRVALPMSEKGLIPGGEANPEFDAYLPYRRGVDELDKPATMATLARALEWFDKALEIDPEYAAAQAGRCRAFVVQFVESRDTESIPSAESACGAALELNPNLDVVHAALGRLHFETGRVDDAERAYLAALQINDRNVDAMTGISNVYRLQRRPDEAEAVLAAAIGVQPGNWNIYMNLGVFHYRQGRFVDAAQQFDEVVSIDPENVRALSNLGSSQMMAGDFSNALATYQRSVEVAPDRFAYANLGLMNYYLGRYDDAEAALRQAIEIAPRHHLNWSNLGDILYVSGKHDEAAKAYANADQLVKEQLGVNANDPGSQMDHAWIHAMLGEREIALTQIATARGAAPDDPYASYIEGLIRNRFGDTDAALDSFERAVAQGYSTTILKVEPLLLSLRGDPRFERLTRAD